jgi:hypothetical protein
MEEHFSIDARILLKKAVSNVYSVPFVLLFVHPMRIVFGLETLSARVPTAARLSRRWVSPVA